MAVKDKRYKLFVITLSSGGLVVLWGRAEAIIPLWLALNGCGTYVSKSHIKHILKAYSPDNITRNELVPLRVGYISQKIKIPYISIFFLLFRLCYMGGFDLKKSIFKTILNLTPEMFVCCVNHNHIKYLKG